MPSGSVGVCDEACRLNGSRYESNIGSLRVADHSPSPTKRGKNRPDGGSSSRSTCYSNLSPSILREEISQLIGARKQ